MQSIWENTQIGDPVYQGLTLGGLHVGTPLVKEDYPGLRAIRLVDGTGVLAVDLPGSYTVPSTPGAVDGARGVIGYSERTTDQGTFTAETDLTGLSVAVTAATARRIRITGQVRLASSIGGDRVSVNIKEGTTRFNASLLSTVTANLGITLVVQAVITPTAGAHTYKLSAARSNGTGNVTSQALADTPAFILVEDIGPVTPGGGGSTVGPTELWY